ncbi:hypothetical protein B1987_28780 [Mycobacterium kansasii]|nr:hypothetical protein B1987_28780 [Mycobacterium kansasii]VBA60935.1 hypothetical protein LAUMK191_05713 [Mycobacterium attenuatum]
MTRATTLAARPAGPADSVIHIQAVIDTRGAAITPSTAVVAETSGTVPAVATGTGTNSAQPGSV